MNVGSGRDSHQNDDVSWRVPLIMLARELALVLLVGFGAGGVLLLVTGAPELAPEATSCAAPDTIVITPWVTVEAAHELDDALFVDARARDEYEAGHVTGALSVPMETGSLPGGVVPLLASARTVVTYCDTQNACAASTQLAGLLASEGLGDVRVLEGGFDAWLERGYPAEAGPCLECP